MNLVFNFLLVLSLMLFFSSASHADVNYNDDRYKIILEREPFGQELVIDVPTVTPAQEIAAAQAAAQAAEKELRLCFIFEG